MKITVSKHTTIDWEAVRKQFIEQANNAIDTLLKEAQEFNFDELPQGKSVSFSSDLGKITVRRSKD
jgi:hypothetical protein